MATTDQPAAGSVVVAKIGTSSITDGHGDINEEAIAKFCGEVAELRALGHRVVAVTSGAIAAGLPALGLGGERRPRDSVTLQALSAVGQSRLMAVYDRLLGAHDLVSGQVLLAPLDFEVRAQYLHAQGTLQRLLELGVVPVVNENDAIADDEIRFGDNDRLAALVANAVQADLLVLLTDTVGLLTADPRLDASASLIEEIVEFDEHEARAGGAGSDRGSGGMASKVSAAKIASWSGVRTVIAAAHRPHVLVDALAGTQRDIGTVVAPRDKRMSARKLWIAFAVGSSGTVVVDAGARTALEQHGRSLLPAGVVEVRGGFAAGAAVEVCTPDGTVFAKGRVAMSSAVLEAASGGHSTALPDGTPPEVIHRDDLVILPA